MKKSKSNTKIPPVMKNVIFSIDFTLYLPDTNPPRSLKTLTPDKFLQISSWAQELTLFGTRFEKITMCGVFLVTDRVKEIWRNLGENDEAICMVVCHSSESSICARVARHSLAFSGLFQASQSASVCGSFGRYTCVLQCHRKLNFKVLFY